MLRSWIASIAFQPPKTSVGARSARRGRWAVLETPSGFIDVFEAVPNIPGTRASRTSQKAARSSTCILYCHGNAEDIDSSVSYLQRLSDALNLPVLAFEYPGYAGSLDPCSERGVYDAAEAAWEHARSRFERVVLFGRSLGSGPATHLAARAADDAALAADDAALAGLVLQSPLTSGIGTVLGGGLARLLRSLDVFANIERIGTVTAPVTIMHGEADWVVPCRHGRRLFRTVERAPRGDARPSLWVRGAGHNDMPEQKCIAHVVAFVRGL